MRGHWNRESVTRALNPPGCARPSATVRDKSTERLEIKASGDNLTSAKAEIPLSPPCLHKPLGRKA